MNLKEDISLQIKKSPHLCGADINYQCANGPCERLRINFPDQCSEMLKMSSPGPTVMFYFLLVKVQLDMPLFSLE